MTVDGRLDAIARLGGEIMGLPGQLGVVTPGALADLLLIDGDPWPTSRSFRIDARCA